MLPKAGDLLKIQNRFYIVGLRNVERSMFYCSYEIQRRKARQDMYAYITDRMLVNGMVYIIG